MGEATSHERGIKGALKEIFGGYFAGDPLTQSAALAYYTALSFAPLLMLLLWCVSLLGDQRQAQLIAEVRGMVGGSAAQAVDDVIRSAESRPSAGTLAGLVGIGFLLFSASGVFGQLQSSLNHIWGIEARPGSGLMNWVRKRLLSFGTVLVIAFLLLVSLVATSLVTAVFGGLGSLVDLAAQLLVVTVLFALMFKFLPDAHIAWGDVWVGAAVTTALFLVGKRLISLYLIRGGVGSGYGAAGSLIALLVWVYYSGLIVLLGAQVTRTWARRRGSRITPVRHARFRARSVNGPGARPD